METPRESDYDRLLRAADDIMRWKGATAVAIGLSGRGYAVSEAMISNWKKRGISKEGRLRASAIIGIRPVWLETGDGEMHDQPTEKNVLKQDTPRFSQKDAAIMEAVDLMKSVDHDTQQQMLGQIKMLANEFKIKKQNSTQRTGT